MVAVALAAVAAPFGGLGAQAGDPFAGVWRLNVEKSLYEAGRPPRSFTRTYEDRGGGVIFLTVDSVSASGAAARAYLVYKRDGKPYPESAAGVRTVRMVAVRAVDNLTEEVGTVTDGRVTEAGNTLERVARPQDADADHEGRHARWPPLYKCRRLRQTVRVADPVSREWPSATSSTG